jgi:hypothetical protein
MIYFIVFTDVDLSANTVHLLGPLAYPRQREPTGQHDSVHTKTYRIQDPGTCRLRKNTRRERSDSTARAACSTDETNCRRLDMAGHEAREDSLSARVDRTKQKT